VIKSIVNWPKSLPFHDWAGSLSRHYDAHSWFASLALHVGILVALAATSANLPSGLRDLDLVYETLDPLEEEIWLPEEFHSSLDLQQEMGNLSQSQEDSALAAAMESSENSLVVYEHLPLTDYGDQLAIEYESPVFQGPEFSTRLPVLGTSSVGIFGAVGAVDRITQEILASVEQEPTLVVWLFDQSGSLKEERKSILERFQNIYHELGVIEAADNPAFKKHSDKPLLTVIAGFGEQVEVFTPQPTDDIQEMEEAIKSIGESTSPIENTFQAVTAMAEKYRMYRLRRELRRNVMFVIFTDETGDDADRHEATIELCRRLGISVYVIGRPAPFGREAAYVKWIDPNPQFDQRPQWVPIDLGPESLMLERLNLPFVGSQGRDELIDSGFGPYALTKLCIETGGIYFTVHPNRRLDRKVREGEIDNLMVHIAKFFDPEIMRKYEPDYISVREYQRRLQQNRAQAALVEAAQISRHATFDNYRLRFVKRDDASFNRDLSTAQREAAIRQPVLDRICEILLRAEADREKLPTPRWRAGYDLALGRALASKVRNDGYNAILAQAKFGVEFQEEKNNTLRLRHHDEFVNSRLEKLAEQAETYLRRVVEEHPDTPWEYLANQDLRSPFGWRWEESYTDPEQRGGRPPERPPRRDPPPL